MTYNTNNTNKKPRYCELFESYFISRMHKLCIPLFSSHEKNIFNHPYARKIVDDLGYMYNKSAGKDLPLKDFFSLCDFVEIYTNGAFNSFVEVKCFFKTLEYSSIGNLLLRLTSSRHCIFPQWEALQRLEMPYMFVIAYFTDYAQMNNSRNEDDVKDNIEDYVIIKGVGKYFTIDSPKDFYTYLSDSSDGELAYSIYKEVKANSIYYHDFEQMTKNIGDHYQRESNYENLLSKLEKLEKPRAIEYNSKLDYLAEPLLDDYTNYGKPKPQPKPQPKPKTHGVIKILSDEEGIAYKIKGLADEGLNRNEIISQLNLELYRNKKGEPVTNSDINQVLPAAFLIDKDMTPHLDELKYRLVALYKSDLRAAHKIARRSRDKKYLSKAEIEIFKLWVIQYYKKSFRNTCLRYTWLYHKNNKAFVHTRKQALNIAINSVKPKAPKPEPKPKPKAPKPEPKAIAPTFTAAPAQLDLFSYSNDQKVLDAIEELRQDIASIKEMLKTHQFKKASTYRVNKNIR